MRESWRDQILKEFTPGTARLTLVADPDGLLTEEGIAAGLRERGFDIIEFDDSIAFRFVYESKYRAHWDRGEMTDLVVVLRAPTSDLHSLPYDLLHAGRRLSFNLGDLFPHLSYPVVAALGRGDLDALYRAQIQFAPGPSGDNATKDFVLRHVFHVAPELIKEPHDLLSVLLRRHYRGERIPGMLDARFVQVLRQNNRFDGWPLEEIVPDREAFLAFLQERWPIFLNRVAGDVVKEIYERDSGYALQFPGPSDIPFDHDDVRVYIDNLFLEGMLRPVSHEKADVLAGKWVAAGIHSDPEEDQRRRLGGLVEAVGSSLPGSEARYQEWLTFAQRWAELTVLWYELGTSAPPGLRQRMREVWKNVDTTFPAWVQKRYGGLYNQPPVPPVMLHHVPRVVARYVIDDAKHGKAALVVLDGLGLDQWVILRDILLEQGAGFHFREQTVFAWVPTITSVSRQSAFAGKPPLYFPSSIHHTNKEGALWSQFWEDRGLAKTEVFYSKGVGEGNLDAAKEELSQPRVRAAGLVVGKVDKIMHGMEMGMTGMHNQIRQWARQGFMAKLLDLLLDLGFKVFLTSDHGNIEAVGCGRPAEGAIADQRGERVRVYPEQVLRNRVKQKFPDAIEWPPLGLPEDYLPLLASGRTAFTKEGDRIVAHGGISLEELVVPFVEVQRRRS